MWAREARLKAMRGFTLQTTDLRDHASGQETISTHFYRYTLHTLGSHVILTGNHAMSGVGDSIVIELDSSGRKLTESIYDRGEMQSIERWRYDLDGKLMRRWFDFARDGWHPPEEYFYSNGILDRIELRNPDGSLAGSHLFHHRDREVIEYDTTYINGVGQLTSLQLTSFDSLGRAVRYQMKSFGFAHNAREPYGFLNIYHDTTGGYRCDQFALVFEQFGDAPWRTIRYDSTKREEIRTVTDTETASTTDNRYLPDERFVASNVKESSLPMRDLSCDYNSHGMLERAMIHDYHHSVETVLSFKYIYSAMGP